ncbi:MAG: glycosyltransferase [Candidatus Thorarchaeota archaeon]|nr:glycosyltransferase [Candidatus Thorarchaeota archaeon]
MSGSNYTCIGLDETYDLILVGFYAVGGVATYLYQLWNFLNRHKVRTLLLLNFEQLGIIPTQDAIEFSTFDFSMVPDIIADLERIEIKAAQIEQIDCIPFFLPLALRIPTLLHMEYWPHQLSTCLHKLKSGYKDFLMSFRSEMPNALDCWKQLVSRRDAFENRWNDRFYLMSYWWSLQSAASIGLWIEGDSARWSNLIAGTPVDKSKIEFHPPRIDTEMFYPPRQRRIPFSVLVNGKKTFMGNFQRTIQSVQAALRALPHARLLVSGIDSLCYPMETQLVNKIEYLGNRSYIEVPENFRQADLYVLLSSTHEGFSVSTLEAMACGCVPVVSHFVSENMSNAVRNRINGFVVEDDNEVSAILEMIAEDHELLGRLREKGQATIEGEFSMKKIWNHSFYNRNLRG